MADALTAISSVVLPLHRAGILLPKSLCNFLHERQSNQESEASHDCPSFQTVPPRYDFKEK